MSAAMELVEEQEQKNGRGRPKGSKNGRTKNRYMKVPNLSMFRNEYLSEDEESGDEITDSFYNEDYIYDRLVRDYISPLTTVGGTGLEPISKEEWITVAETAWQRYLDTEKIEHERKLKELIAQFKDDPTAIELLQKELNLGQIDKAAANKTATKKAA